MMEPCHFDMVCPLCPYRHGGTGRAARWAAIWTFLADQEEHIVDVPVSQTLDKLVDIPVETFQPPQTQCVKKWSIIPSFKLCRLRNCISSESESTSHSRRSWRRSLCRPETQTVLSTHSEEKIEAKNGLENDYFTVRNTLF